MKAREMANKRKHKRFIKRCNAEFLQNDVMHRGISSDFSIDGMFIRTSYPAPSDEIIDVSISLPDGSTSKIKGRVTRSMRIAGGRMTGATVDGTFKKNGMGIEIIERDAQYLRLISSFLEERQDPKDTGPAESYEVSEEQEPKEDAATQQLLISLLYNQQALVNLLVKHGLLNRLDLLDELTRLRKR
jgi:hypothetical protein